MPVGIHVQAWTLTKEVRDGIKALQRQHSRDIEVLNKAHEKEIARISEQQWYAEEQAIGVGKETTGTAA